MRSEKFALLINHFKDFLQRWKLTRDLYGKRIATKILMRRILNLNYRPNMDLAYSDINSFLKCFSLSESEIIEFENEFQVIYQESLLVGTHPSGIKFKSGFVLYCLIRKIGPQTIMETGFQAGRSSFLMRSAQKMNGFGTVRSLDIRNREIPLPLKRDKDFHLDIVISSLRIYFASINREMSPEFWFLDADNRHFQQLFELRAAKSSGKIIVVNNSHVSGACDAFLKNSEFSRIDFIEDKRLLTILTRN